MSASEQLKQTTLSVRKTEDKALVRCIDKLEQQESQLTLSNLLMQLNQNVNLGKQLSKYQKPAALLQYLNLLEHIAGATKNTDAVIQLLLASEIDRSMDRHVVYKYLNIITCMIKADQVSAENLKAIQQQLMNRSKVFISIGAEPGILMHTIYRHYTAGELETSFLNACVEINNRMKKKNLKPNILNLIFSIDFAFDIIESRHELAIRHYLEFLQSSQRLITIRQSVFNLLTGNILGSTLYFKLANLKLHTKTKERILSSYISLLDSNMKLNSPSENQRLLSELLQIHKQLSKNAFISTSSSNIIFPLKLISKNKCSEPYTLALSLLSYSNSLHQQASDQRDPNDSFTIFNHYYQALLSLYFRSNPKKPNFHMTNDQLKVLIKYNCVEIIFDLLRYNIIAGQEQINLLVNSREAIYKRIIRPSTTIDAKCHALRIIHQNSPTDSLAQLFTFKKFGLKSHSRLVEEAYHLYCLDENLLDELCQDVREYSTIKDPEIKEQKRILIDDTLLSVFLRLNTMSPHEQQRLFLYKDAQGDTLGDLIIKHLPQQLGACFDAFRQLLVDGDIDLMFSLLSYQNRSGYTLAYELCKSQNNASAIEKFIHSLSSISTKKAIVPELLATMSIQTNSSKKTWAHNLLYYYKNQTSTALHYIRLLNILLDNSDSLDPIYQLISTASISNFTIGHLIARFHQPIMVQEYFAFLNRMLEKRVSENKLLDILEIKAGDSKKSIGALAVQRKDHSTILEYIKLLQRLYQSKQHQQRIKKLATRVIDVALELENQQINNCLQSMDLLPAIHPSTNTAPTEEIPAVLQQDSCHYPLAQSHVLGKLPDMITEQGDMPLHEDEAVDSSLREMELTPAIITPAIATQSEDRSQETSLNATAQQRAKTETSFNCFAQPPGDHQQLFKPTEQQTLISQQYYADTAQPWQQTNYPLASQQGAVASAYHVSSHAQTYNYQPSTPYFSVTHPVVSQADPILYQQQYASTQVHGGQLYPAAYQQQYAPTQVPGGQFYPAISQAEPADYQQQYWSTQVYGRQFYPAVHQAASCLYQQHRAAHLQQRAFTEEPSVIVNSRQQVNNYGDRQQFWSTSTPPVNPALANLPDVPNTDPAQDPARYYEGYHQPQHG